jgi:hypothetical protein
MKQINFWNSRFQKASTLKDRRSNYRLLAFIFF